MPQPVERDPRTNPWGLYVEDDLPAPWNSGTAVFLWFTTPDAVAEEFATGETAEYLRDHLDSDKMAALHGDVRALAGCAVPGDVRDRRLATVNSHLRDFQQIRWFGTFQELCSFEGGFPEQVRGDFRFRIAADDSSPLDGRPIESHEIPEFVNVLAEYGI